MEKPQAEQAIAEIEDVIPQEKRAFLKTETRDLSERISALTVKNRQVYEEALTLGLANKHMLNQFEELEEAFIRPFEDALQDQKKRFRKIKMVLESNDEEIRTKLRAYQNKRVNLDDIKTVHVSDFGRVTIQERQSYEVIDESLVPRDYLKVDEQKIGRAVRSGIVTNIPGVRIKKELTTAFVLKK